MGLDTEKRKAHQTQTYRTYVRFSDENLRRAREWVRKLAQSQIGDVIG